MRSYPQVTRVLAPSALGMVFVLCASAQVNVLTQHNNNSRTGANLNETVLNTSNVNSTQFGKLFSIPVDGQVYAQPLYVSNLSIPGAGTHNVVYVATEHDTVFAFDADGGALIWQTTIGVPANCGSQSNPVLASSQCPAGVVPPFTNLFPEVGITATPVIDSGTNTIYVVDLSMQNGQATHWLHALDITNGNEKFGGPVQVSGTAPGTSLAYNPSLSRQRVSLTLVNGNVVFATGSYSDIQPYHGWVFAYSASTLQQTGIWCDTPSGTAGGIWQSGAGIAVDSNNDLYVISGNGTFDGVSNFSDSYVKLGLSAGGFTAKDYFTPSTQAAISSADLDLGIGGPTIIPDTKYVVGGSKSGMVYLLDTTNMGHFNTTDNPVQEFQATSAPQNLPSHTHSGLVYWNGPNGQWLYLWGEADFLKAFQFTGTSFQVVAPNTSPVPISQSTVPSPATGPLTCLDPDNLLRGCMPGGFLSISANGSTAGTGILWAATPYSGSAEGITQPGILYAFDASNLNNILW